MIFPGESAPLAMRHDGQPISDSEAIGVARRCITEQNEATGRAEPLPETLPLPNEPGPTPVESFRLPRRRKWRARARADMEGRSLTEVINELLEAYASAPPGTVVQFSAPRSRARRQT